MPDAFDVDVGLVRVPVPLTTDAVTRTLGTETTLLPESTTRTTG